MHYTSCFIFVTCSNGCVIDPGNNLYGDHDVLVVNGKIAEVAPSGSLAHTPETTTFDAQGQPFLAFCQGL